jgi:hypothetical protein
MRLTILFPSFTCSHPPPVHDGAFLNVRLIPARAVRVSPNQCHAIFTQSHESVVPEGEEEVAPEVVAVALIMVAGRNLGSRCAVRIHRQFGTLWIISQGRAERTNGRPGAAAHPAVAGTARHGHVRSRLQDSQPMTGRDPSMLQQRSVPINYLVPAVLRIRVRKLS